MKGITLITKSIISDEVKEKLNRIIKLRDNKIKAIKETFKNK